ncbi:TonB-dependent receptor [Muricauda sp. SCSIO 64092]|uniref:SusC/RagA family TonB-linked outer membrane protein n=1 Tax=Allomuricauda sp. SCSIO 64092 TaxID=2908842 RepID=UPI001FF46F90|nr:TonB-dependent receptor [Muricauda sp. SCSIO 64092]UOY05778.1 TonB-dependent receptor [Muricauda sp. SCSIO 64092]
MRTFLFLFCTAIFAAVPSNLLSQNPKIKIDKDKMATVDEVFDLIVEQTDYKFFYEEGIFKNYPKIPLKKGIIRANKLLSRSLSHGNLEISITNGNLVAIKEKPPTTSPNQQSTNISGVVKDVNGQPLPGANIVEKGTSNGTQADFDGNFSILVEDENAVLVVSYIGFNAQEIPLQGRTNINVVLEESAAALDEVVVVGYGTVQKSDLSGSVSSVDPEQLENIPVARVDQALQGRAAGVSVAATGGAPGSAASIRIRGSNSINGDNNPLFVVDGFLTPDGFDLNSINPNDIQSIEILKDASAISIYGVRGSNGVILITTKNGKGVGTSKPQFNLNHYTGISNIVRKLDIISGPELAQYVNEVDEFEGALPTYPDVDDVPNVDYQDLISRTAITENLDFSVQGNSDDLNYFLSLNYFNQEGVIRESGIERYQVRINIDANTSKKFSYGTRSNVSFTDRDNALINWRSIFIDANPLIPIRDEDGEYTVISPVNGANFNNPEALFEFNGNRTRRLNALANFYVQYEPIEGLVFRSTIGSNLVYAKQDVFNSAQAPNRNQASVRVNQSFFVGLLNENTVSYNKKFGDHSINSVIGFTWQTDRTEATTTGGDGIPNDANGTSSLILADPLLNTASIGLSTRQLVSFPARLIYNYKSKYILTLAGRLDGSSVFAVDNKYSFFPSVSAAWNIGREKFLEDSNLISQLKLRASFGVSGSQAIGPYRTLSILQRQNAIINDAATLGLQQARAANPNLEWETTDQIDIGLELGFFNDRLRFEFDYYDKTTNDLLVNVQNVPRFVGLQSPNQLINVGSISNKGLELTVGATVVDKKDFRWTTDITVFGNRNKVLALSEGNDEIRSNFGGNAVGQSRLVIGSPVLFYGLEYLGVFQTQEEIDAALANQSTDVASGEPPNSDNDFVFVDGSTVPGSGKFRDTNGDGALTDEDYEPIGNPEAKFSGGINNSFIYKNWSLDIYLQGSYGNDIYFGLEQPGFFGRLNSSLFPDVLDRWTPQNTDTRVPRAGAFSSTFARPNTQLVKDGSHLRIRNVRLGYNVPTDKIDWVSNLNLYILVDNLAVFSNYKGYDPEVGFGGNNTRSGVDDGLYPRNRTFTLGINAKF